MRVLWRFQKTTMDPRVFIFTLLVCFLFIVTLANFIYVDLSRTADNKYLFLVHQLEITAQDIPEFSLRTGNGEREYFNNLRKASEKFDDVLLTLKQNKNYSIFNNNQENIQNLSRLEEVWGRYKQEVEVILGKEDLLIDTKEIASRVNSIVPKLQNDLEEVQKILITQSGSLDQVQVVGKEVMLAERIMRNVDKVLRNDRDLIEAAGAFARDTKLFGRILIALVDGNETLQIGPINIQSVREILLEIQDSVEYLLEQTDQIVRSASEYSDIKSSVRRLTSSNQDLSDIIIKINQTVLHNSSTRFISPFTGSISAILSLLVLAILIIWMHKDAKKIRATILEKDNENRYAVQHLLTELEHFSNGDLTTRATAGNEITSAIAQAVNIAIGSLKKLILTIRQTADQVSKASQNTQTIAQNLVEAADHQAREVIGATAAINAIAASIEHVSSNAAESAQVAGKSVNLAKNGVYAVQNNMSGMERIRIQIQETSKQIKRLGESSQEIGDTVSLIDDITEQTNILALNAAIQAAMAGEVGRGFAVVAEEVQRLAERSGAATRQIETLVRTIQKETNETVRSMEQTMAEVIQGAKLSQEAGVALEEIEMVSRHLADLIQKISLAARLQATNSGKISQTMHTIQEITTKTATGTNTTANSIGFLTALSIELKNSISGFKLPTEENQ